MLNLKSFERKLLAINNKFTIMSFLKNIQRIQRFSKPCRVFTNARDTPQQAREARNSVPGNGQIVKMKINRKEREEASKNTDDILFCQGNVREQVEEGRVWSDTSVRGAFQ